MQISKKLNFKKNYKIMKIETKTNVRKIFQKKNVKTIDFKDLPYIPMMPSSIGRCFFFGLW